MKTITTAILISIFGFVPAFAQTGECLHYGWVEDKDPKGTNIRDAPSLKGKIIGNIPRPEEDYEEAIVGIIGYSNGWLKIRFGEMIEGTEVFNKTGWVLAKLVTAQVEDTYSTPVVLYSLPKKSSKKIGTIPNNVLIKIVGFDCFGFKIRYKGKIGWIPARNVCGNPVKTCP